MLSSRKVAGNFRENGWLNWTGDCRQHLLGRQNMESSRQDFVRVGTLEELEAKGRLVVHGRHRPILLLMVDGSVFALDNRCPHMGFPLDRGSIEDGILTCHWHHARFEVAGGC